MARCTAPVYGHRTESGRANCPVCGRQGRGYGYRPTYSPSYASPLAGSNSSGSGRVQGSGKRTTRATWSRPGSPVLYTPTQLQDLTPIRERIEVVAKEKPELCDAFLCHAWADRQGVAKDLHDLLNARGVRVWFSENDIPLGVPFLRSIDKGLAKSRVGLVLVTPALLQRLAEESVADKELSVLLQRQQLVPIVHGTTYDALRDVSPLLASRNGVSTAEEDTLEKVAEKLADFLIVRPC
ncbi:toll/interleukin-1 receptor domain-containing protein [bacterium]|nr:toll/interleukin-1 receptor domain-containing protein [bacterium]